MYVTEEDARYLSVRDVEPVGTISDSGTWRWIAALEKEGLIDRSGKLLALSSAGHAMVSGIMQDVFNAQRLMD